MAISGAITAAATIGGAVIGNQQKQKAKGQAGQAERDAEAAQKAADAKLQQSHDATIQAESQAGAVARKKLGGTVDDGPPSAPLTPPAGVAGAGSLGGLPGNVHTLLTGSQQRKALLGQ